MSIVRELRRRNLFRIAAAYAVVAWLFIEHVTGAENARVEIWEQSDTLRQMTNKHHYAFDSRRDVGEHAP